MFRNDHVAATLIPFLYALAGDPRQSRPRPRAKLAAFADALLQRNTTSGQDREMLEHLEAGLDLAFRQRLGKAAGAPGARSAIVAPAPRIPPAAPAKRSHHKRKPAALAAEESRPARPKRGVNPPAPREEDARDVPANEVGRGDPRAVDPGFDQEEADSGGELDAKGHPRKTWRERERERQRRSREP